MTSHDSNHELAASRPAATLMMILCGLVSAGAASAATPADDVPRIVVRYSAQSLATEAGARSLYARLVHAAAQACPDESVGSRLPSPSVAHCRQESLARAVREVGNPRLAAVYASSIKSG